MSDDADRPDEYHLPGSVKSLNVLPHSGKVEQLRAEVEREKQQPVSAAGGATPEPAAPHINRITASPAALRTPERILLEGRIVAAIRTVFDPEIPVNIYDLGLIYDIDIDPDNNVNVRMTLTAPGCPVAGTLPVEVKNRVSAVDGVNSAEVELVWEPQWSKDMMSEEARLELGFF
jgi:FeS assembly SUF system protein